MVARFHEGCLYRRVDGRIEEYIFTEASDNAVNSWANHIEKLLASRENPKVTRWLIDLRLSGPLPLNIVTEAVERLQNLSGTIGKRLRVAYLTDNSDMFTNLFSSLHGMFDVETSAKWFNSSVGYDQRPNAINWLMTDA